MAVLIAYCTAPFERRTTARSANETTESLLPCKEAPYASIRKPRYTCKATGLSVRLGRKMSGAEDSVKGMCHASLGSCCVHAESPRPAESRHWHGNRS